MTRDDQIAEAIDRLDVLGAEEQANAWVQLRPLGYGIVPHLLAAYPRFRKWQGRTALVYYATRYARISEEALELGLAALDDRSYMVRYRACALLAYSLREDVIPTIEAVAKADDSEFVRSNAQKALNAIKARNHHLWADSSLSGRTIWHVNPGDINAGGKPPKPPGKFTRLRLGIRPVPFRTG